MDLLEGERALRRAQAAFVLGRDFLKHIKDGLDHHIQAFGGMAALAKMYGDEANPFESFMSKISTKGYEGEAEDLSIVLDLCGHIRRAMNQPELRIMVPNMRQVKLHRGSILPKLRFDGIAEVKACFDTSIVTLPECLAGPEDIEYLTQSIHSAIWGYFAWLGFELTDRGAAYVLFRMIAGDWIILMTWLDDEKARCSIDLEDIKAAIYDMIRVTGAEVS